MILVHYGRRKFDLKKFEKIENTSWIKPNGGFWTSPIQSDDWKKWCLSEGFKTKSLRTRMILELRSKKICVINSYKDLVTKFIWIERQLFPGYARMVPDFEKMSKQYDAIHLTLKGQYRTRWSLDYSLYGWDCETVLILNGKKVKQIPIKEYYKNANKTNRRS